jgi:hypothetical protein
MAEENEKTPAQQQREKDEREQAEKLGKLPQEGAARVSAFDRGRPNEMADAEAEGAISTRDQDPQNPERAGFAAIDDDPRMMTTREEDELPKLERGLAEEAAATDATDDWHIRNKSRLENEPARPFPPTAGSGDTASGKVRGDTTGNEEVAQGENPDDEQGK